jgi:hypothetical protein
MVMPDRHSALLDYRLNATSSTFLAYKANFVEKNDVCGVDGVSRR